MDIIKQIIEHKQGNGCTVISITKRKLSGDTVDYIYWIEMQTERFSTHTSLYSSHNHSFVMHTDELKEFHSSIGKALLFLEAKG